MMIQAKEAPIEYTVYTFDPPEPRQKGENSWKRHFCSLDRDQALIEARTLLQTRKFHKIEIKEKFFDPKANRTVDRTYRVMKEARPWSFRALFG